MSKIIKLDKNLANQIAAGEVVERPISVIKELVENSIDAKASSIKIEIKKGGIDEIIISDNGEGIDYDDLKIIFEKYTTSKIKSIEDLYNIMTFGFRGEALASISSVSKTTIISKIKDSLLAYKIENNGGDISNIQETSGEKGTKIIVKDLFFNTPARLNYLKQPRTEFLKIKEFLEHISLSYPEISFNFISDNKQIFFYQNKETLKTRIYNIFGEDFANNLLNIDFSTTGIKVNGYVSNPKISFNNKKRQVLFVNRRIIKSHLISKAIYDAYNRYIPHLNNPGYILNLIIDPTQIDVNVHPRKLEIRFAQESQIFKVFYHAIEEKLKNTTLLNNNYSFETTQNITNNSDINQEISNFNKNKVDNKKYYIPSGTKFKSYSPYKDTTLNPKQTQVTDAINFNKILLKNSNEFSKEKIFEKSNDLSETKLGKIIGQVHNSYIVLQTNNGIQIIDQHALAERIIYEKLTNNQKKTNIQGLLIAETLKLTPSEIDIVEKYKNIFDNMGFEFEILDAGIILISAIPEFIKKENIQNIFLGVIKDIGEQGFEKSITLEEVKNKIFAYTACRSAVKFGNKLNLFEMNKLLNNAYLSYSSTCPHGRPVIYEITLDELKNKYER